MTPRALLTLVVLLGFGLSTSSYSQESATATIEGRVVDSASGDPVVGAAVYVLAERSRAGGLSGRDGAFRIERVPAGTLTLRARLIGYRDREVTVRTTAGQTASMTITMGEGEVMMRPVEVIGESPEVYSRMTGTATRVDARTLAVIAPIGTQEVVQYIPGINSATDDGIGNSRISVGIRGLNPRRSSRVLVLEDGVPIAPAVYLYPNMYYNPPAERIEAVEVIKGSASVRYGPQTMGGVVNYLTRRPGASFGALGQLTVGTNGYLTALAEIGGWGSETIQPELQLLFKRGDGFRDNNEFAQYNGTLKLNIVPDDQRIVYVKANVDYENSSATYTGLTEYTFATDPTFNPKENDEFTVLRGSLDVLYSNRLAEDLMSTTKVYANYFDRQWWRENDVFVRPGSLEGGERQPVPYYEQGDLVRVGNGTDNYGNLRTFYVVGAEQSYEIDHTLFGAASHLEVGGRLHWDRFIDNRVIGDAPDARTGVTYENDPEDSTKKIILGLANNYETTAIALFASNRLSFGDLTITPGIRVEVFEQQMVDRLQGATYQDRTSHVILPGIGANLALGDWNLFAGLHRGYTPPSSGTLAVVNWGANMATGGLDLESEKSWNAELGARAALDWAHLEIAGFHMSIEDLVAAGIGSTFKNLGRVRTYGLEVGTRVLGSRLDDALPDLDLAYTLLGTEVVEGTMRSAVIAGNVAVDLAGREMPYAPHHTLNVGLSKELPFGLAAHADMQYVSRAYTDFENIETTYNRGDTGPVPAYMLFNASASYRITPELSLSVAAKNLLDRVYIGSRLHSHPGMPEANQSSGIMPGGRRQINLTVRYALGR
ncbi:MAG TPA: TonB-dependent receptor [Candidatus Kapabacteria bacterium]|nr:TonB-dependent receptor [Candidatus Kapabacteria bacterium]